MSRDPPALFLPYVLKDKSLGEAKSQAITLLLFQENNKKFDESEISLFEAFGIFCGIGIHNTKVYEGACKLMAKQKVALDCLSYHASASDGDTEWLVKAEIPSAETYNLFT